LAKTLFLLDKNILRILLGGIARSLRGEPLLFNQTICFASFQLMTSLSDYILVTAETYNLINMPLMSLESIISLTSSCLRGMRIDTGESST